jgi:hypothetical protein
MMVGLIGFGALLTDGALMQVTRRDLQAAADAAALAGAMELPNDPAVVVNSFVTGNGFPDATVTIQTPYEGDNMKIEVVLEQQQSFTFGRIFDLSGSTISARAVAMKIPKWDGEALPLINQQDYNENNNDIWNKVEPGNFESMIQAAEYGYTMVGDCDFSVDYENGVEIDKGVVADKKQEIECVLAKNNGSAYLLSLSEEAIEAGEVYVKISNNLSKPPVWRDLDELKQNDIFLPCSTGDTNANGECETGYPQLVLLEIYDADYEFKDIGFEVKAVYNIFGKGDEKTLPEDGIGGSGGSSYLVE